MNTAAKQIILAIDDELLNIRILGEKLKNDYQIVFSTSGREGIEIAESGDPPDLILLDVMMPEMNGYEVCKKLKESPKTRDIPVIFITSLSETEDVVKGFTLGAVDYVTKPFKAEELKARVQTHLALKKAKADLEEALANVKNLSGMLPICASCKKIRDDKGYWQQVEKYVTDRSEATFSHSLCPDCVTKLYPDMAKKIL